MGKPNFSSKIIENSEFPTEQIKIIYWGPGEVGKTTNFFRLKDIFHKYLLSSGFSIETSNNRTLWNDSIHFHFTLVPFRINLVVILMTTTGQRRFLQTREYILQNADGAIFVADSDPEKAKANLRSFQELQSFLPHRKIPLLILLNKRDLPSAVSVANFKQQLSLPEDHFILDKYKTVYEGVASDPCSYGDVKRIFLDLIQLILKDRFIPKVQSL